jgi:L-rhamnose mutarotase
VSKNLPASRSNNEISKIEWDNFTKQPKDYDIYRTYLGQKISILKHNEIAFAKNPDGSVDYSKKINFDDLKLDLKNIGFKISNSDFASIMASDRIEKIDSLTIFYNQLKNNPWDYKERISDLVSAANLDGDYDTNFYLIKKWLCTTYAYAFRGIDPFSPESVYSRVVFILYSDRRGLGKTEFFRKLGLSGEIEKAIGVSGAEIYAETPGEIPKDERNFAIDRNTKMLYVFDDINNLLIKGEGTLRSIISQENFTKRALYTDSNKNFKKRSTFAGTTNYSDLLRNETENRYMLFTVKDIMDFDKLNNIDYFQLWSQIREEVIIKQEKVSFNSKDFGLIESLSKRYIYHDPAEDTLNTALVFKMDGMLSFTSITKELKEVYSLNLNSQKLGSLLQRVFKKEGVDLKYKKGDQRYYRLEWRNNIRSEKNQDK